MLCFLRYLMFKKCTHLAPLLIGCSAKVAERKSQPAEVSEFVL